MEEQSNITDAKPAEKLIGCSYQNPFVMLSASLAVLDSSVGIAGPHHPSQITPSVDRHTSCVSKAG